MIARKTVLAIVLIALPVSTLAEVSANDILGVWVTAKGKAYVEITEADGRYSGRITWLKDPFYPEDDAQGMAGEPKVDRENPAPEKRSQPIVGLKIMEGFEFTGRREWRGGTIYDPENGKTYKCKIWLTDEGTLKVRGFVGISLFGRTEEWVPVTGLHPTT